jgi:hypothetical protein
MVVNQRAYKRLKTIGRIVMKFITKESSLTGGIGIVLGTALGIGGKILKDKRDAKKEAKKADQKGVDDALNKVFDEQAKEDDTTSEKS